MVENNEGLKGYLCHMFGMIVELNWVNRRGRALSLYHNPYHKGVDLLPHVVPRNLFTKMTNK